MNVAETVIYISHYTGLKYGKGHTLNPPGSGKMVWRSTWGTTERLVPATSCGNGQFPRAPNMIPIRSPIRTLIRSPTRSGNLYPSRMTTRSEIIQLQVHRGRGLRRPIPFLLYFPSRQTLGRQTLGTLSWLSSMSLGSMRCQFTSVLVTPVQSRTITSCSTVDYFLQHSKGFRQHSHSVSSMISGWTTWRAKPLHIIIITSCVG